MKRKYEIVYIFDSALEESEVNEHLERFHELLKSPETPEPITGIVHWGKRTLAYPIKRRDVGYYVVAHFETDTQLLREFERIIKLNESVLRYLIVINEGLSVDRFDSQESDDLDTDDDDSYDAPASKMDSSQRDDSETQVHDDDAAADHEPEPTVSSDGGKD